jgi:predicted ATPase
MSIRFDPERLASPSLSEAPEESIHEDGSGLAGVLADMAATRPDDFTELQEGVRSVVPSVRRLRCQRVQFGKEEYRLVDSAKHLYELLVTKPYGYEVVLDTFNNVDIPAAAMSEGTLYVIGLLAAIMSPNRPRLLLIENIESGLHPRALGDLVTMIRRLLDQYKDIQIVATSHSPYLLDHLDPAEIRLMCWNADGGSVVVPITEHPEFDNWKDIMSPGEFWSTVGEKWDKDKAGVVHG